MNDKQKTYHLMIVDNSSSMQSVLGATISGLNEQLTSIRKAAADFDNQEQKVCFVTFDSVVNTDLMWNKEIADIEDFSTRTYTPSGWTALLDAIGIGITKLRNEIAEELTGRKANVIVTIFTDGGENSSKEFKDPQAIKTLIEEIKGTGQWTVAFLGCGEDVFDVAESFGIAKGNTMSYTPGTRGTKKAFAAMGASRLTRSAAYSSALDSDDVVADMAAINTTENFFGNIDLDDDDDDDDDGDVVIEGITNPCKADCAANCCTEPADSSSDDSSSDDTDCDSGSDD